MFYDCDSTALAELGATKRRISSRGLKSDSKNAVVKFPSGFIEFMQDTLRDPQYSPVLKLKIILGASLFVGFPLPVYSKIPPPGTPAHVLYSSLSRMFSLPSSITAFNDFNDNERIKDETFAVLSTLNGVKFNANSSNLISGLQYFAKVADAFDLLDDARPILAQKNILSQESVEEPIPALKATLISLRNILDHRNALPDPNTDNTPRPSDGAHGDVGETGDPGSPVQWYFDWKCYRDTVAVVPYGTFKTADERTAAIKACWRTVANSTSYIGPIQTARPGFVLLTGKPALSGLAGLRTRKTYGVDWKKASKTLKSKGGLFAALRLIPPDIVYRAAQPNSAAVQAFTEMLAWDNAMQRATGQDVNIARFNRDAAYNRVANALGLAGPSSFSGLSAMEPSSIFPWLLAGGLILWCFKR